MTNPIAIRPEAPVVQLGAEETALLAGDLSKLSESQRANLVANICRSLGLNPLTSPLRYIVLNNKLTLYATKDCTDQLRRIHRVSTQIVSREMLPGEIYCVTVRAILPDGRMEERIGAVSIAGLKGEQLANALMKCETKGVRRASLGSCGMGFLDETEVETIPGTYRVEDIRPATALPGAGQPRRLGQGSVTDRETGEVSEALPDAEELAPSAGMLAQLADREFLIATFFSMIPPQEPPATVSAAKARFDHAGQVLKGGLPNPLAPATEAMMAACLEKTQQLITAGGTGEVLDEGMTTSAAWARYQQDHKALKALAGKPAPAQPTSGGSTQQQIDRLRKLQTALGQPALVPEGLTSDQAAAMILELVAAFNAQSRGGRQQTSAPVVAGPVDLSDEAPF